MLGEKRKGTRLVSSSGSVDEVNHISEMARLAQRGDVRDSILQSARLVSISQT